MNGPVGPGAGLAPDPGGLVQEDPGHLPVAGRLPFDVVLAGVGGQGVLTAAAILSGTARAAGLTVKQGEIHGMSQRGGAVTANVRMSSGAVASDLVGRGSARMILSLEPLEALRALPWLAEDGVVVTAASPVENIPDYPPVDVVLEELRRIPRSLVVDVQALARDAGSVRAENVALLGAAAPWLPVSVAGLRRSVASWFEGAGERIVEANLRAFDAGLAAALAAAPGE